MSSKDKWRCLSLRVREDVRAEIEAAAEREKRPLSNFLRLVIAEGIERRAVHRDQAAA